MYIASIIKMYLWRSRFIRGSKVNVGVYNNKNNNNTKRVAMQKNLINKLLYVYTYATHI